jgi:lipoprotein Spr
VTKTQSQLSDLAPSAGWPEWVFTAPYVGAAHPAAPLVTPMGEGANCQRFAYAVVGLFGLRVPPYRSSELWEDEKLGHVAVADVKDLDLVLFNRTADAWGAHVTVTLSGRLLHLSAEVGQPALWQWLMMVSLTVVPKMRSTLYLLTISAAWPGTYMCSSRSGRS